MDYIIGAGAILEAGEAASITPATLHAEVDRALAERARVLAVDFEGTSPAAMQRLLIVAGGWNGAQFRSEVTDRLREQRTCTLADVLLTLAAQARTDEVHLFAHWFPDEQTCSELQARGIRIVSHPVESIRAASLVSGQRVRRVA
ncbi:MAG TPA: hypothetical protein VIO32_03425 [Candidatus Baltobacteraceae bacterium]